MWFIFQFVGVLFLFFIPAFAAQFAVTKDGLTYDGLFQASFIMYIVFCWGHYLLTLSFFRQFDKVVLVMVSFNFFTFLLTLIFNDITPDAEQYRSVFTDMGPAVFWFASFIGVAPQILIIHAFYRSLYLIWPSPRDIVLRIQKLYLKKDKESRKLGKKTEEEEILLESRF